MATIDTAAVNSLPVTYLPRVYWDACIFIAWLKNERPPQRTVREVAGIGAQADAFDAGELFIVTSVLTVTEVLQTDLEPFAAALFRRLRNSTNFAFIDTDLRIADRAQEIRDYYRSIDDGLPTVTGIDAIHLATATLQTDLVAFYTFDGSDPKKNRKQRTLLPLSGKIAGKYPLVIRRPDTDPSQTDPPTR